jgi:hypothetical protein
MGRAEIGQRSAGLAPAARQLLILINGIDSVQALLAKGLGDVWVHLDTLLALRMIEPVPGTRTAPPPPVAVAPAPAAPPVAPPASAAPVAAPAAPEEAQALLALQRRAYQTLVPHFGPDTPLVAEAMLAARSLADYQAALGGIEAKLAIYMGRKQAARAIETLRGGA